MQTHVPQTNQNPPSLRDGHSQTTYTAWSPAGLSRYCTTLNAAKTLLATPPPARLPSGVRCALAHAIATRTRQLDSATRTTKTGYDGLQLTADSHRLAFILYSPRSPRGEGESPSPTAAGSPRNGAPSLPRFGLPAGRRESILMATGPFNLLARSRLSRDGRRGGWAPSALSGGRPGMGGRPVCRFRRWQVSSRGCAAARGLAAPR